MHRIQYKHKVNKYVEEIERWNEHEEYDHKL